MASQKQHDFEQAREAVRQAGLRATPARVATYVLLQNSDSPLTHADVSQHLVASGIDKATVFRNLNDMATAGLLRRTELGDRVWRFELISADGEHSSTHPHFLCVDCGVVSCMDEVKLTAGSLRASQEVGEITEILLRGHCNNCSP